MTVVLAILAATWLGIGWTSTFRRVLGADAEFMVRDWGSLIGEVAWAAYVGILAAVLGPLPIAARAWAERTKRSPQDIARRLASESRDDRLARLEREAKAREAYIAKLEDEVGVR